MSKRGRSESDGVRVVDGDSRGKDEQSRSEQLELQLAFAERQLTFFKTLKMQKLRDAPGTESQILTYSDPLAHLEFNNLYSRYNDMALKLFDAKKESMLLGIPSGADTLFQENKRIKMTLDEKISENTALQADLKDALTFTEQLKDEVMNAKKDKLALQREVERLQQELFSWQQQAQIAVSQQHSDYTHQQYKTSDNYENVDSNGDQRPDGNVSPSQPAVEDDDDI